MINLRREKPLFFIFLLITVLLSPLVHAEQAYNFTVLNDGTNVTAYDLTGTQAVQDTDALVVWEYIRDNLDAGKVYVGNGTYLFSGDYIQTGKAISWEGSGSGSILRFADSLGFCINATNGQTQHLTISDFRFYGYNNGSGLTITQSNRVATRGLSFSNHEKGLSLINNIVTTNFDTVARNNTYGVYISEVYGLNQFYGGAIVSNSYGIFINASNGHNQFYGLECEVNFQAEIKLGATAGSNLFEGLYMERTAECTPYYFEWDASTQGSNTFIHCKFASQISSDITVEGNANAFTNNYFAGGVVVNMTFNGDGNTFIGNRANTEGAKNLDIIDNGEDNVFFGNYFYDNDINDAPATPATTEESTQDQIVTIVIILAIVSILGGALGIRRYY